MFKLRDYKLESINNIYDSVKKGHHSIIVQSPPRTGKNVIMHEIARRATKKGNRVMFMVHRKEIVNQVIKDYRAGKVRIVTNTELFTEGLDLPNVDCVIMLRPTKSLSLYLQFAMRSMNPREGKTTIIIDQVGNVHRFGLPTQDRYWSLEESNRAKIQPVSTCLSCFAAFYRNGNTCPFCGADLVEEREIEVVDKAELKKVVARRKEMFKNIINDKVANNVVDKRPSDLKNYV